MKLVLSRSKYGKNMDLTESTEEFTISSRPNSKLNPCFRMIKGNLKVTMFSTTSFHQQPSTVILQNIHLFTETILPLVRNKNLANYCCKKIGSQVVFF